MKSGHHYAQETGLLRTPCFVMLHYVSHYVVYCQLSGAQGRLKALGCGLSLKKLHARARKVLKIARHFHLCLFCGTELCDELPCSSSELCAKYFVYDV